MRSEWTTAVGGDAGAASPPVAPAGTWAGARERELSLADAERRIDAEVAALGWGSRLRVLDDDEPTATQCALWYADETEIPYGMGSGKGLHGPAWVAARYEAVEHALSGPGALDSLPLQFRDAIDLARGPLGTERVARVLAEQPGASMACLRHTALDGGDDFDVPLALWAPWYLNTTEEMARWRARLGDTTDYRRIRSYSSNTGCAIGATYDEALLHALNESAERDALAIFLLRSVYDRGPMPARILPEELPGFLRERLDRAADLVEGPVHLLDLTTDLEIPVVMAYAPAHAKNPPSYGMGASLSGENAVERAVTEFVQGELLAGVVAERDGVPGGADVARHPGGHPTFDDLVAETDITRAVHRRLGGYPGLLACARLDFADRLWEAEPVPMPRETVPSQATVATQRAAAVERIGAAGHRVAAHRLWTLPHGTTVVQVQCPGLERFHQITTGHLALPGQRGRRLRAG